MIKCNTYKWHSTAIFVKCDICTTTELVSGTEGETDRCLAHDWIHANGWKTLKYKGKWIQLCPECKTQFYQHKRNLFFEVEGERE